MVNRANLSIILFSINVIPVALWIRLIKVIVLIHICWVDPSILINWKSPFPILGCLVYFLAHLSRRLTRWAYSIPMVRCPSSSVVVVHTFKLEYLWSQLANLDQILCVASLGWGKGCIRFWGRLDQNSSYHGNRKPPLTYNGKNDVSTFSRLLLIRSF